MVLPFNPILLDHTGPVASDGDQTPSIVDSLIVVKDLGLCLGRLITQGGSFPQLRPLLLELDLLTEVLVPGIQFSYCLITEPKEYISILFTNLSFIS